MESNYRHAEIFVRDRFAGILAVSVREVSQ